MTSSGPWAANVQAKTGKRMLGFPAGPKGLMHRFFEGFLYPAYTGGVVTTVPQPGGRDGVDEVRRHSGST